jgi:hypothetical protein
MMRAQQLRHELFRGRLDRSKYEESELRLSDFLDSRKVRVSSLETPN